MSPNRALQTLAVPTVVVMLALVVMPAPASAQILPEECDFFMDSPTTADDCPSAIIEMMQDTCELGGGPAQGFGTGEWTAHEYNSYGDDVTWEIAGGWKQACATGTFPGIEDGDGNEFEWTVTKGPYGFCWGPGGGQPVSITPESDEVNWRCGEESDANSRGGLESGI